MTSFGCTFVAGATGYTGRSVVPELVEDSRVDRTVAHIRPESSKLESMTGAFESLGAEVDTTPWNDDSFCSRFEALKPDLIFCLIGTTRARRRDADDKDAETYEAVDYGLTALLIRACVTAKIRPKFVYLSSMGVRDSAVSSYLRARFKAENYLKHSELPYVIARPSFISGEDRSESRPLERFGSVVSDAALGLAGALGARELRDTYQSMTGAQLAAALVDVALDPECVNVEIEADELRRRGKAT